MIRCNAPKDSCEVNGNTLNIIVPDLCKCVSYRVDLEATQEASGTCDICFERFRGEPGCLTAPHSIPCGHVFCKTCLTSVVAPRKCPLCRHPFALQTIRKIHLETSQARDREEMDLVQRYLNTLDCTEDGPLLDVVTEIGAFLQSGKEAATISRVLKLKVQCESLRSKHQEDKKRMEAYQSIIKRLEKFQVEDSKCRVELKALRRQAILDGDYIARLEGHIAQLEEHFLHNASPKPRPTPSDTLIFDGMVKALRDAMDLNPVSA